MVWNIWRFIVKDGCEEEFIRMNNEDWPSFFSKSKYYQGSRIIKKLGETRVYMTIDRWNSKEDFDKCVQDNHDEFYLLDSRHRELYEESEHLEFHEVI